MDKKLVVKNLVSIFLIALVTVIPVFKGNNVAFAQEASIHQQVVLADWVPMSASAKMKPPSAEQVYKALLKCLRKGPIGIDQNSTAFWTCMASELGQGTWDANYQWIICAAYWYYDKTHGIESDACGECYTNGGKSPCDPTCSAPKANQDCCDLKFIKCMLDAKGNPLLLNNCRTEQSICYGG